MATPMTRIDVRCPQELKTQISALAKQRGVSQSEIGLAALQEMLARARRPEVPVTETLVQLDEQVVFLRRLLEVFIRWSLSVTDDARTWSEERQERAEQQGAERWQHFLATLALPPEEDA